MPLEELKYLRYAFLLIVGLTAFRCTSDVAKQTYPFYPFEKNDPPNINSDPDSGPSPEIDFADTDSEQCADNHRDDLDRCIKYVNWKSDNTECGEGWATAFETIQEGIDAAGDAALSLGFCEVWVAKGIYRSFNSKATDTIKLRENIAVYGSFEGIESYIEDRNLTTNTTTLSGYAKSGNSSSYHVVSGAANATLDGFSVIGGRALGDPPHHRGGGIYLNSTATTISNCSFSDNEAIDGGAIFAYDNTPVIQNSVFKENSAVRGGAVFILNGTSNLQNLMIDENTASQKGGGLYLEQINGNCNSQISEIILVNNSSNEDGGGLYNDACNVVIEASLVENNYSGQSGGGIAAFLGEITISDSMIIGNTALFDGGGLNFRASTSTVSQTEISENNAGQNGGGLNIFLTNGVFTANDINSNVAKLDGGGVYVKMDYPMFLTTLISGNQAYRGAGMFNEIRGNSTLINCTLDGNRASEGGGLFNNEESVVKIFNSIFWLNEDDEIFDAFGSKTTASYCDIYGGYIGLANSNNDPKFIIPGSWSDNGTEVVEDDTWTPGDYHLQPNSPCIDTGNKDCAPAEDGDKLNWHDTPNTGATDDIGVDRGVYDYKE